MTQPLFDSTMAFDSSLPEESRQKTAIKQRLEQVSSSTTETGLAQVLVNFVKQGSQSLLSSLLQ